MKLRKRKCNDFDARMPRRILQQASFEFHLNVSHSDLLSSQSFILKRKGPDVVFKKAWYAASVYPYFSEVVECSLMSYEIQSLVASFGCGCVPLIHK